MSDKATLNSPLVPDATNGTPKMISLKQKNVLVNHLAISSLLNPGKSSSTIARLNSRKLWIDLVSQLNALDGPKKSIIQWKKTYTDMKYTMKKKKEKECAKKEVSPFCPLNEDEELMVSDILGMNPTESLESFEEVFVDLDHKPIQEEFHSQNEVFVDHKPIQEEFHSQNGDIKIEYLETLEDEDELECVTPVAKKRKIDEQCHDSNTSNSSLVGNNDEFKKQNDQQFASLKNVILKALSKSTRRFETKIEKLQDNVTKLTEILEKQTKTLENIKNQPCCTCNSTMTAKLSKQTNIPVLNKPIKVMKIGKLPKWVTGSPSALEPTVTASTSSQVHVQDTSIVAVQSNAESSPTNNGSEVQRDARDSKLLRGAAPPGTISLEAAEAMKFFHLFYIKAGTTHEKIKEYLAKICDKDVCLVEPLKARGNYASFKIGVPSRLADKVLLPENWPADVCLKPWQKNFRSPTTD